MPESKKIKTNKQKYKPKIKKIKVHKDSDLSRNELVIKQITKETTAEERRKVVEKIYKEQEKFVFTKNHISKFVRDYQKKQKALAKLPKFTLEMVSDDSKLTDYLNILHEDIDNTDELDYLLKEITNNILNQYKRFNDPRHLKSSNIEAINELIRTRVDIKFKKINSKKVLFDIINKKKELDLKFKNVINGNNMVEGIFNIKDILTNMDKENIHADITINSEDENYINILKDTNNEEILDDINKELTEENESSIIPLKSLPYKSKINLKMNTNDYADYEEEINENEDEINENEDEENYDNLDNDLNLNDFSLNDEEE